MDFIYLIEENKIFSLLCKIQHSIAKVVNPISSKMYCRSNK